MTLRITRDTRLCMSISARPSNVGTRFHNFLYEELGLDYVYKAFAVADPVGAVAGIRALGIRGCAVSMPHKEAVIPLVDELDPSAAAIGAVNTIVDTDGHLKAYNTDYVAVAKLVEAHAVPKTTPVVLRGSGGMGKAVAAALRDTGFATGAIVSRNEVAGRELAERCGWTWRAEVGDASGALLVNVTPIGMAGAREADDLAFTEDAIAVSWGLFDVVAMPSETPAIVAARRLGRPVITGAEVMTLQAVEQFVLYTGIRPSDELIARATAFSRA